MRILLLTHGEPPQTSRSQASRGLMLALRHTGYEVRLLSTMPEGMKHAADQASKSVVYGPGFSWEKGSQRFCDLSETQFAIYQNRLRHLLDAEIEQWSPHTVHATQAWIWSHLALESGVPYVVYAGEMELREADADARFQRLAEESVENASRVIVENSRVATQLVERLPHLEHSPELVPNTFSPEIPAPEMPAEDIQWLTDLHKTVAHHRYGDHLPD